MRQLSLVYVNLHDFIGQLYCMARIIPNILNLSIARVSRILYNSCCVCVSRLSKPGYSTYAVPVVSCVGTIVLLV